MGVVDYILGCLAILVGTASLVTIARSLAERLLAGWRGAPFWLAVVLLAVAVATLTALLPGTLGLLDGRLYLALLLIAAVSIRRIQSRTPKSLIAGESEGPAAERAAPPGGDGSAGPAVAIGSPPAGGRDGRGLAGRSSSLLLDAVGLAIASVVVGLFAVEVWDKLGTGMTGFDSTWYHGPFAAGFAASGDTFSLHFLAPQFLSWFYPQNSELIHSLAILGFGNDLLSPLVNLGWLAGCLIAAWAIGRPYGGSALSLAGVALILGSAAMADQAGEARNDIVGVFFLLAGLAILVNAASGGRRLARGSLFVLALAAGLAIGTKINFIPAAIVLAAGGIWLTADGRRARASLIAAGGLAAGGAYWYLRNLVQSGNPLPWIDSLGPLSLPSPDQELGGRDAASVLGYLDDPGVIKDWFFPGLADGFGDGWVLLTGLALLAVVLCLRRASGPARRVASLVALALLLAWIAAPTSASGPAGEPAGFVSGLRYLAPALAVGMALLGAALGRLSDSVRWTAMAALVLLTPFVVLGNRSWTLTDLAGAGLIAGALFLGSALIAGRRRRVPGSGEGGRRPGPFGVPAPREGRSNRKRVAVAGAALAMILSAGYAVQDRYFENRYASPEFTTAGLSEAFVWARGIEGESIGTNATRQYPLFGTELENDVQYLGVPGPDGGFVKTDSCEQFRYAIFRGDYRYLVLTLDRENPDRPFPREIQWIEGDPDAVEVLKTPPTAIYELKGPLDPATCP